MIDILQQAALNVAVPAVDGVRIGLHYRPAARDVPIGGDWYDVLAPTDDRLVLVIADVAGHGPDSAGLMVQVCNILRTIATQQADPADLLREANKVLVALQRGQLQFVTCCAATLSPATRDLRWALAGHPPALLRTAAGQARFLSSAPGLPLGVDGAATYVSGATVLGDGDRLVLYTDGLIEGRTDSLDDGMERLVRGVERCAAAGGRAGGGVARRPRQLRRRRRRTDRPRRPRRPLNAPCSGATACHETDPNDGGP